jgi:hypothetical protein
VSSQLIVATARIDGVASVAGRRLAGLPLIQVADLILVVVGLNVGPERGGLGLPGPRRLGLDLARTATK